MLKRFLCIADKLLLEVNFFGSNKTISKFVQKYI